MLTLRELEFLILLKSFVIVLEGTLFFSFFAPGSFLCLKSMCFSCVFHI